MTTSDGKPPDYLLGYDAREWSRLEEQHALWAHTLLEQLDAHGPVTGLRVLEVGCGTGALLSDLADRVGPEGRVVGLERDAASAERARERVADRPQAEVRVGDLLLDELGGPWDLVVARWVLSFLPDPGEAVRRLAAALRTGGLLVVQDYVHDALRVFPDTPEIGRTVDAFRAAWRESGGDLWVAGRLPALYAGAKLELVSVVPAVKSGAAGSPVWRWVERFLHEHIETVVASGHLSAEERAAFEEAWANAAGSEGALLFSPLQVTVVGRWPGPRPVS